MTYPAPSSLFRLELAFGADPDGPPSSWSWTDVTADLDGSQTIQISRGNADEQSNLSPSEAAVLLRNEDGKYTPNDPRSPHWPHVVDGVPARLSYNGSVRLIGRVASIEPEWPHGDLSQTADLSAPAWELGVARVRMVISGITRWISRPDGALESPLRRHITSAYGDLLVVYLPLEDGEDTRLAEAAVPGQTPLAYNMSEGRAPQWTRDDSCPGSAPLPEWPVGGYISWSDGSRIAGSGGPPWAVLMVVRVPPGSGEAWLCEWRTNGGTWSRWSLKITSGGALQVVASDSDASPETVTYTSTLGVADGRWHAVSVWVHLSQQVVIRRDNAEEEFSTIGVTVGAIRSFRPRPVFADPTDKSPIGLGHAFVLVDPGTSWIPESEVRQRHIPVDRWAGEPAVDRFERLAVEGGIPYRLVLPVLARDQFDRTVPVGWGTADLGGEWQTLGDTFSVSAGEGIISTSVGGHAHLSGVTVTDVDMRASVMASGQDALSYLTVRDGPDYTYTVDLW